MQYSAKIPSVTKNFQHLHCTENYLVCQVYFLIFPEIFYNIKLQQSKRLFLTGTLPKPQRIKAELQAQIRTYDKVDPFAPSNEFSRSFSPIRTVGKKIFQRTAF